jgi:hypothetical protein
MECIQTKGKGQERESVVGLGQILIETWCQRRHYWFVDICFAEEIKVLLNRRRENEKNLQKNMIEIERRERMERGE